MARYLTVLLAGAMISNAVAGSAKAQSLWPEPSYVPSAIPAGCAAPGLGYQSQSAFTAGYASTAYPTYTPTVSTYFYVPQQSTFCASGDSTEIVPPQSTQPLFNRGPILIMNDEGCGDRSSQISNLETQIKVLETRIAAQNRIEQRVEKHAEALERVRNNIEQITQALEKLAAAQQR